MERQNAAEYKMPRSEVESVKKCITDYMGFLFLGIGAVFSAWGGIGAFFQEKVSLEPLAYSSLVLSHLIVFMLFILIYKFVSHNRYVGYCLTLGKEYWESGENGAKNGMPENEIHVWELALALLRRADSRNSSEVGFEFRQEYGRPENRSLPSSTLGESLRFLCRAMVRLPKTQTWGFPLTIVRIFLIVTLFCLGFGVSILWPRVSQALNGGTPEDRLVLAGLCVIVGLQLVLWGSIAKRFHSIMSGGETVQSFHRRFKEIRKAILSEMGINARWREIEDYEDVQTSSGTFHCTT